MTEYGDRKIIDQQSTELLDLPKKIYQKGTAYAQAKAQYEFLEQMTKTVLAKEMNNQQSPSGGKEFSEAKLERIARTSQKYQDHLMAVKEARELSLQAEASYVAVKSRFEAVRSLESTRREQLSKGIYN